MNHNTKKSSFTAPLKKQDIHATETPIPVPADSNKVRKNKKSSLPKLPVQPGSAFTIYTQKQRNRLQKSGMTEQEANSKAVSMWRELSEAAKGKLYIDSSKRQEKYKNDLSKYQQNMAKVKKKQPRAQPAFKFPPNKYIKVAEPLQAPLPNPCDVPHVEAVQVPILPSGDQLVPLEHLDVPQAEAVQVPGHPRGKLRVSIPGISPANAVQVPAHPPGKTRVSIPGIPPVKDVQAPAHPPGQTPDSILDISPVHSHGETLHLLQHPPGITRVSIPGIPPANGVQVPAHPPGTTRVSIPGIPPVKDVQAPAHPRGQTPVSIFDISRVEAVQAPVHSHGETLHLLHHPPGITRVSIPGIPPANALQVPAHPPGKTRVSIPGIPPVKDVQAPAHPRVKLRVSIPDIPPVKAAQASAHPRGQTRVSILDISPVEAVQVPVHSHGETLHLLHHPPAKDAHKQRSFCSRDQALDELQPQVQNHQSACLSNSAIPSQAAVASVTSTCNSSSSSGTSALSSLVSQMDPGLPISYSDSASSYTPVPSKDRELVDEYETWLLHQDVILHNKLKHFKIEQMKARNKVWMQRKVLKHKKKSEGELDSKDIKEINEITEKGREINKIVDTISLHCSQHAQLMKDHYWKKEKYGVPDECPISVKSESTLWGELTFKELGIPSAAVERPLDSAEPKQQIPFKEVGNNMPVESFELPRVEGDIVVEASSSVNQHEAPIVWEGISLGNLETTSEAKSNQLPFVAKDSTYISLDLSSNEDQKRFQHETSENSVMLVKILDSVFGGHNCEISDNPAAETAKPTSPTVAPPPSSVEPTLAVIKYSSPHTVEPPSPCSKKERHLPPPIVGRGDGDRPEGVQLPQPPPVLHFLLPPSGDVAGPRPVCVPPRRDAHPSGQHNHGAAAPPGATHEARRVLMAPPLPPVALASLPPALEYSACKRSIKRKVVEKNSQTKKMKVEPAFIAQQETSLLGQLIRRSKISHCSEQFSRDVTKSQLKFFPPIELNGFGKTRPHHIKTLLNNRVEFNRVCNDIESYLGSSKEQKVYVCNQCQLKFVRIFWFKKHKEYCKQNYICDICNRTFTTNKILMKHRKKHEISFKCDNCDAQFDTLNKLVKHNQKAHVLCMFECNKCNLKFKNSKQLKNHLKENCKNNTSEQVLQFNCANCNEKFATKIKLELHVKKVHKARIGNVVKLKCDVCTKTFHTVRGLQKHVKNYHNDKDKLSNIERNSDNMIPNESEEVVCNNMNKIVQNDDLKEFLNTGTLSSPNLEYVEI